MKRAASTGNNNEDPPDPAPFSEMTTVTITKTPVTKPGLFFVAKHINKMSKVFF
jgi:hypothetical protein